MPSDSVTSPEDRPARQELAEQLAGDPPNSDPALAVASEAIAIAQELRSELEEQAERLARERRLSEGWERLADHWSRRADELEKENRLLRSELLVRHLRLPPLAPDSRHGGH